MVAEPLKGLKVVDLSHMLAGPLAARRLGDLGARVIKLEPKGGEALRSLPPVEKHVAGSSTYFHAFNTGKDSVSFDMSSESDLQFVRNLVREADVVIQSFRPGVLDKVGLGYSAVSSMNEKVVYASVSGYGDIDAWRREPGQDLLAQARSGIMWLSGIDNGKPAPLGFLVADTSTANILIQGILAALVGRGVSGKGAHVETSLLEALIELQIDAVTQYANDLEIPRRSRSFWSASAYASAPYGVYPTSDGYIAIASLPQDAIKELLGEYSDDFSPFNLGSSRDEALNHLADCITKKPTSFWKTWIAERKGWCAEVLDWKDLTSLSVFDELGIFKRLPDGGPIVTLAPVRFNGERPQTGNSPAIDNAGVRVRQHGWN